MADTNPELPEEPKRLAGLMGLVKAVAIVSLVVLVEVVAAAVLIPSAQDAETTARELLAARQGVTASPHADRGDATKPTDLTIETREVDLGRFNVTRYNPEADTTLIIDFELFGVVLAEDESAFLNQFESNKVRVREQVIMTLGGTEATDLTDAELGLLKRRILEKTNRALGKPLVREVLFSKFNFVER